MEKFIGYSVAILGLIVAIIILLAVFFGVTGLIIWGIGNSIIYLFGLNYIWTFWHGVICSFVIWGICWIIRHMIKLKGE